MPSTSNPKIYRMIQSPGIFLDIDLSRAKQFNYDQLSDAVTQIRLLELLPGKRTENIKCRLIHTDRAAATGTYEPLSYCWGDQSSPIPIYVNDTMTMKIGTNLHTALVRLRQPDEPRMLWVDALCINQDDVHEKNVQVQLMRSIYENGTQTVVWIGEEDDPILTPEAFRIWEFANKYADAHPGGKFNILEWKKFQRLENNEPEYRYYGLEYLWSASAEGFAMDAVLSLFTREWFSRVWIVQEIAVSKQALLICGQHTISWDRLQRAVEASYLPGGDVRMLAQLMDQRTKYLQCVPEDLSAKIWNVAAPARATDPRDRVYALLGLMGSLRVVDIPVEVDYNLSAAALFRNLTRRHLELGGDVGILACSVGCRHQTGDDLSIKGPVAKAQNADLEKDRLPMPSWVWRPIETEYDLSAQDLFAWEPNGDNFGGFQASGDPGGGTAASVVFDDGTHGTHLLGLEGYEFDRIIEAGPVIDPPGLGMQFDYLWASVAYAYMRWRQMAVRSVGAAFKETGKMQKNQQEQNKYMGTDESRLEAFRKTIQPIQSDSNDQLAEHELATIFKRFDAFMLQYFAFLEDDLCSTSPLVGASVPTAMGQSQYQHFKPWRKKPGTKQPQQKQPQHDRDRLGGFNLVRYSMQLQRLAWMHKFKSGDTRVVDLIFRILKATNRRFCLTTTGYMVLAPRQAIVGDAVVLLKGARAPFILRRSESTHLEHVADVCAGEQSPTWKIVGDCRVHGIMHGEAWDESKCRRLWIN